MIGWRAAVAAVVLMGGLQQQEVAPADGSKSAAAGGVSFTFDHPAMKVPHWFVDIDESGKGTYSEAVVGVAEPGKLTLAITVSEATQTLLREGYPTVIAQKCETKAKNIAQTGTKRILYGMKGGDSGSQCVFNYSDDAGLMKTAAAFQAIAETVQIGARLKHEHRFDRLGLNADLDLLGTEAKEGRAIELQNIAPVLQSIADDDDLMDVVQRKAKSLLQDASLQAGK